MEKLNIRCFNINLFYNNVEGLKTANSTSMAVVFTLTPLLAGLFDLVFKSCYVNKVWITVIIAAKEHYGSFLMAKLKI